MSSACSGSRAALRGARTRGGRSRVRRVADLAGVRLGTVVVVDPSADNLGDCGAPQSRAEVVQFGWAECVGGVKDFRQRSRRPRRLGRPACPLVPGYRGPEQPPSRRFLSGLNPYLRHQGAGCSADPEPEDTAGCGVGSVAGAGPRLWPVSGATSAGVVSLGAPAPGTSVPAEPLSAPLGLPSVVRPPFLFAPSSTCPGTCGTCPGASGGAASWRASSVWAGPSGARRRPPCPASRPGGS